jgi:hypothetical protein
MNKAKAIDDHRRGGFERGRPRHALLLGTGIQPLDLLPASKWIN